MTLASPPGPALALAPVLALAFANAFASTLLIAITARFAIRLLAPLSPARFGGFTLAIGYAIARYSGTAPFGAAATGLVLRAAGTLAGLTILWFWWFRHRPARRSPADTPTT